MSGILCTWASLPDESLEWYEGKYVPFMCSQTAESAIHTHQKPTGMENEPNGHLTSPWNIFTIYEVQNAQQAMECWQQARKFPTATSSAASLGDNTHLDARSFREVKRWQAQDWDGDVSDVVMTAVMEWSISAGMSEDVLSFYKSFVGPTLSSSPDILRFRFFEVEDSMTWKGDKFVAQDKGALHTYITLVELESEQWPWDVVVELGKNKEWVSYFEKQDIVRWQVSDFQVTRTFPKDRSGGERNGDEKIE